MLETAIKSEIDRIRLVADDIESLNNEFRSTIGDTRNLADLANDIGDRLLVLQSLEATVTGAAGTVAEQVNAQLGQATPLLQRLAAELAELRTSMPQLHARVDRVASEVAEARAAIPDPAAAVAPLHDQLGQLRLEVAQLRTGDPDQAGRLDEVAAGVNELRARPTDASAAIAPLALRLDQLTAAFTELRAVLPDVAPVVEAVATRLESIDARTAATNGALSQVHGTITLAASQVQQIAAALASLQDAPEGPEQVLAPVIDRLAVVFDSVAAVHENLEQVAIAIGSLRTDRSAPDGEVAALGQRVVQLSADVQSLASELREQATAAAAAPPPPPPPPPPPAAAAAAPVPVAGAAKELEALGARVVQLSSDLQALTREVRDARTEGGAKGDDLGGASAALVASAAAAMARLEGRIDSEFDTVQRQAEALGTLVNQAIESIERVERTLNEVQPVSERVRAVANRTLDVLRTNRRRSGGPPQLGR